MAQTGVHEVYTALRTAVLSLDLLPGEKLSERGLEGLLGASRTPIRAALMRLEAEGLTQRTGRGWQVTPIDLSEIRAVMEFREIVEIASVALAVEHAGEFELAALRDVAQSRASSDDGQESVLRDGSDFHVALARLSRNPFIVEAMGNAMTRLSRTRWLEVRSPESRTQAKKEHEEILAAVVDRDTARSQELISRHSQGTRDRVLAYLSDEHRRLRGRGFAIIETAISPPQLPVP